MSGFLDRAGDTILDFFGVGPAAAAQKQQKAREAAALDQWWMAEKAKQAQTLAGAQALNTRLSGQMAPQPQMPVDYTGMAQAEAEHMQKAQPFQPLYPEEAPAVPASSLRDGMKTLFGRKEAPSSPTFTIGIRG